MVEIAIAPLRQYMSRPGRAQCKMATENKHYNPKFIRNESKN